MINFLAIAAMLVGSVYSVSIPINQTYPTSSGTGLNIKSVTVDVCTSLPCTIIEGTVFQEVTEFDSEGNYNLTYESVNGIAVINDETIDFVEQACSTTVIVSGDTDGNPCTLNKGGKYKFVVNARSLTVMPVGEYLMSAEIFAGGIKIAGWRYNFVLSSASK